MQEVIASGVLGEIVHIRSSWSGFQRRWDWQTRQDLWGGSLLNTGEAAALPCAQSASSYAPVFVALFLTNASPLSQPVPHTKVMRPRCCAGRPARRGPGAVPFRLGPHPGGLLPNGLSNARLRRGR